MRITQISLVTKIGQLTETEPFHYVHCNAGVKAYLANATHDHKSTIADVCESVMLCSHQGKEVQLCPVDIFTRNDDVNEGPRKHLARQLVSCTLTFLKCLNMLRSTQQLEIITMILLS